MPPRKPWHLSNGEQPHDPNQESKRDRVDAYDRNNSDE